MEGDPRIDKLMRPVLAAIDRHVKDSDAKTEIYNRAYEALLQSLDALDAAARVTAKQIAENAKNLRRTEAAEAKVAELEKEFENIKFEKTRRKTMNDTRDKIIRMTQEELREAIAEAMGYVVKHNYLDDYGINPKDYWVTPTGRLTSVLSDWPTNIADAWELVEEIRANGFELKIDTDLTGSGNDYNVAILAFHDGSDNGTGWTLVAFAEALTAPLAISRAWLMWKEEK